MIHKAENKRLIEHQVLQQMSMIDMVEKQAHTRKHQMVKL